MYKEHPVFQKPGNGNAKIWHYMDFSKFISMLDTKNLFFSRADLFEDKFEGLLSKVFSIQKADGERNILQKVFGDDNITTEVVVKRFMSKFNKEYKRWFFLNSWHLNEYKSMAMWKTYSNTEGIAIQSTYRRLTEPFSGYKDVDV